MEIKLPILGGDARHSSRDVSNQYAVNWIPEQQNYSGATEEWIVVDVPGSAPFSSSLSIGSGYVRGMYKAGNGSLYVAKGQNIYEIHDRSGTMASYNRGSIATQNSRVYFADNGTHVALVDGNNMYLHELGSTSNIFLQTAEFASPSHIVFLGGYLIVNSTTGDLDKQGSFYYSGVFDATSWSALNYANAEGFSDPITAMGSRRGDLWLFGSDSYEVWGQTGDSNQPFARVGASQTNIGCSAKYSPETIGDSILWVGSSKAGADMVYMSNGYEATPISSVAISKDLGNPIDAIGWTYSMESHPFYMVSSSGNDSAWGYDLSTGKWHRRESRAADSTPISWKNIYAEYFNNQVVTGFADEDYLAVLDNDTFTEADGGTIVKTLRTTCIVKNGLPIKHKELRVTIDTGRIATYSDDPQIMMRFSDDGGYTWSKSFWRSFGKQGQYGKPVRWLSLGASRERIYEFQVSADARCTILSVVVDVEQGVAR